MRNWRINLIFLILVIFGAAIISRLFFLQVINHKFYQAQALGQQTIFEEIEGVRGEIFFKDNIKSLAVNNDKWLVYVVPQEIQDKEKTANSLSEVIKDSKIQILSKIKNGDSYTIIKNKLTEKEVNQIKDLKLTGVYLDQLPGRYYPQEKIAASVVGFVGGDGAGQYGIEGYYNEILKGEKSFKEEPRTFILFDFRKFEPTNLDGSDLYSTIDYNIQFEAESLLKEAPAEARCKVWDYEILLRVPKIPRHGRL